MIRKTFWPVVDLDNTSGVPGGGGDYKLFYYTSGVPRREGHRSRRSVAPWPARCLSKAGFAAD